MIVIEVLMAGTLYMEYHRIETSKGYAIVRSWKFLFWTIHEQLYYGWCNNGLRGRSPYIGHFNHFEWDVENRCKKSWNGGEQWVRIKNKNAIRAKE